MGVDKMMGGGCDGVGGGRDQSHPYFDGLNALLKKANEDGQSANALEPLILPLDTDA